MKRTPFAVRRSAQRSGFTLVEVLVSMAVLILVVVLVANLTNSAANTITSSSRRGDGDTQARAILSRIGRDFVSMVKSPDLDYTTFKGDATNLQSGGTTGANDRFAFYAETAGYFSGGSDPQVTEISPYSLVAYDTSTDDGYNPGPVLQRLAKGLGWAPGTSWSSMTYHEPILDKFPNIFDTGANRDPDYKTVADHVFRMEYTYLLKATDTAPARLSITPWDTTQGHTGIDGFRDVAAIVVGIAVLNSDSRLIVSSYSDIGGVFPDAVDGFDIESRWLPVIEGSNFASLAGIPKAAASGVRVYQRYFYLDAQ